jgi:hypothetical protein
MFNAPGRAAGLPPTSANVANRQECPTRTRRKIAAISELHSASLQAASKIFKGSRQPKVCNVLTDTAHISKPDSYILPFSTISDYENAGEDAYAKAYGVFYENIYEQPTHQPDPARLKIKHFNPRSVVVVSLVALFIGLTICYVVNQTDPMALAAFTADLQLLLGVILYWARGAQGWGGHEKPEE